MGHLSFVTLLLIGMLCCMLATSKTFAQNDNQATKPANPPNRINPTAAVQQPQKQQQQQRQQYNLRVAQARQKRSQRDMDVYDEYFRNMPPHAYNQALQTILQHLQTQLQRMESAKMRPRLGRSPAMARQLLDDMYDGNGAIAAAGAATAEDEDDDFAAGTGMLLDEISVPFQLNNSGNKKSVPYKPRLGKRVPICN